MNAGYVLIGIFSLINVLMLIAVISYFNALTTFAFGFTISFLFVQVVETFREKRYDSKFHNYRRRNE